MSIGGFVWQSLTDGAGGFFKATANGFDRAGSVEEFAQFDGAGLKSQPRQNGREKRAHLPGDVLQRDARLEEKDGGSRQSAAMHLRAQPIDQPPQFGGYLLDRRRKVECDGDSPTQLVEGHGFCVSDGAGG